MNDNDHNQLLPPIQLLIIACNTVDQPRMRYGWLRGYCLLTYSAISGHVHLHGDVRVSDPFADDYKIVDDLANTLHPDAVLAGLDLTETISRLGRLPIEAGDQAPSLALLAKLKAMLEQQAPIDLAIDDLSQTAVALQVLEHELSFNERFDGEDGISFNAGVPRFSDHDIELPDRLAAELADTAGACMLAIGDVYLADELQPRLLDAWQRWRTSLGAPPPTDEGGSETHQ